MYIFDGGTALLEIAGMVYEFKEKHYRYPQSLEDLIMNNSQSYPNIRKVFDFYQDCGFQIKYCVTDKSIVRITLIDGDAIFLCINDATKYYFYVNSVLIREYRRNNDGNIVDERTYE
jgi:hypothetical protein